MVSLWNRIWAAYEQVRRKKLTLHAAAGCYFLVLSLFPALLVVLSMVKSTGMEVESLLRLLDDLLPAALLPEVEYLVVSTFRSASRALVGVSAVTALWSSSRGVWGLAGGFRVIFGTDTGKGWLHTRLVSLGYTFALFLLLLLTLVGQVYGQTLAQALAGSDIRFFRFLGWVMELPRVALPLAQTGLFAAVYSALSHGTLTVRRALPGALVAALGWQGFTGLFSVYAQHFCSYANVYGSVYALALGMLWLYCCTLILFFGALLCSRSE